MTSMTIPLRLTKNDIMVLADELDSRDTGSSELADIIERILKSACQTAEKNREISAEMNSVNPFSSARASKVTEF